MNPDLKRILAGTNFTRDGELDFNQNERNKQALRKLEAYINEQTADSDEMTHEEARRHIEELSATSEIVRGRPKKQCRYGFEKCTKCVTRSNFTMKRAWHFWRIKRLSKKLEYHQRKVKK